MVPRLRPPPRLHSDSFRSPQNTDDQQQRRRGRSLSHTAGADTNERPAEGGGVSKESDTDSASPPRRKRQSQQRLSGRGIESSVSAPRPMREGRDVRGGGGGEAKEMMMETSTKARIVRRSISNDSNSRNLSPSLNIHHNSHRRSAIITTTTMTTTKTTTVAGHEIKGDDDDVIGYN